VCGVQFEPNPDFGSSRDEAQALLLSMPCYERVRTRVARTAVVEAFALESDRSRPNEKKLDDLFSKLPLASYALFTQQSRAWLQVRQRVPVTASQAWNLLGLSLAWPHRRKDLARMDVPDYRKGEQFPAHMWCVQGLVHVCATVWLCTSGN
jgi:hypothetical protein